MNILGSIYRPIMQRLATKVDGTGRIRAYADDVPFVDQISDVDVLMLLAAFGAAVVGHWLEGAVLLFLFSLGNTLETFAFRRTRRSIEALVELSRGNPAERMMAERALRDCDPSPAGGERICLSPLGEGSIPVDLPAGSR